MGKTLGWGLKVIPCPVTTMHSASISRHSLGFPQPLSCLDSNRRSILERSFETRVRPPRQAEHYPILSPLSESLVARSPTALRLPTFNPAAIS